MSTGAGINGGAFLPDAAYPVSGQEVITVDQFTTNKIGTAVGATVSAVEKGTGLIHQTVLSMLNTPVAVSDANVGGGVKIYTFPEGRILVLGATGTSTITTTSAIASTLNSGVTCNWGLGSVITAAQASGTLTTTEIDILASTNITSSTTVNVAAAASNGKLLAAAQFDGTTTATVINWNIGVAGATDIDADATITVLATLTVTWMWLGDY